MSFPAATIRQGRGLTTSVACFFRQTGAVLDFLGLCCARVCKDTVERVARPFLVRFALCPLGKGSDMFRINSQGFLVDCEDDQPVALVALGCVAVEAVMQGQRYLLLRFDCQQALPEDAVLSSAQIHQFALPLDQADALARSILAIAKREPE